MFNGKFGYNDQLPEDIREVFMWLCQDVAALQSKWTFYLELFSTEENTRLLSYLAGASFQIIEESVRNDMTMAICRLSDPPKSFGKENLSLATLAEQCGSCLDIGAQVEEFREACEPVRQYRNKRVGHNDLGTTITPKDHPLPGIGRGDIDRVILLADRILNAVHHHFDGGGLGFRGLQIGGAEELLHRLRMAQEYQEEKERGFQAYGRGSQTKTDGEHPVFPGGAGA